MRRLLDFVASGSLLSSAQAEEIMQELLDGQLQTPEIVQFLRALNARPFRAEELVGFARAMRRCATPVFREGEILPERMVDTCGTGGDDSGTFNISTAAAIVASAAGARVAKHGNRAASSKCGLQHSEADPVRTQAGRRTTQGCLGGLGCGRRGEARSQINTR